MGALAQSLRARASASVVVMWWTIFAVLVVACIKPHPVSVSAVWVFVVVFVYIRSARRRSFRRNLAALPCFSRAAAVSPRKDWSRVTVLVPARNEEKNLEEAARSLASLNYPNLDLWFVNDHSTDSTPQILDALQHDFPRIHVVHNPPITEGWFGKSNALWQTFLQIERDENAPPPDQHWLLFADADVIFEPGLIEQAVAVAERDNLDYLTCMPRLVAKTWAEQFLLPNGWRGIIQGVEYERLNDPRSFPIGIGAFMLVRYTSYRALGGHKALGQWHPEDTLMAAAMKQIGGRVGLAWSPDILRVRFYHGYQEVKTHTLRKMRIFFGDRLHLPLTMLALRLSTSLIALPMMAVGILPQLLAGRFDPLLTALAAAGVVLYVDEARESSGVEQIADFHPLVPWLHPIAGVLRVWFALSLIAQIIANKPMDWRGRNEFGTTDSKPPNVS
jgi:hypothetical protein